MAGEGASPGPAHGDQGEAPAPAPATKRKAPRGGRRQVPGRFKRTKGDGRPEWRKRNNVHACTFEGCDKSFSRTSDLARHECIHKGTWPWVCDIPGCDKRYRQKHSLALHQLNHGGAKPFLCGFEDCGARFADPSGMKRHEACHYSQKEFRCPFPNCRKGYVRKESLNHHVNNKHKGQALPADPEFPVDEEDSAPGNVFDSRLPGTVRPRRADRGATSEYSTAGREGDDGSDTPTYGEWDVREEEEERIGAPFESEFHDRSYSDGPRKYESDDEDGPGPSHARRHRRGDSVLLEQAMRRRVFTPASAGSLDDASREGSEALWRPPPDLFTPEPADTPAPAPPPRSRARPAPASARPDRGGDEAEATYPWSRSPETGAPFGGGPAWPLESAKAEPPPSPRGAGCGALIKLEDGAPPDADDGPVGDAWYRYGAPAGAEPWLEEEEEEDVKPFCGGGGGEAKAEEGEIKLEDEGQPGYLTDQAYLAQVQREVAEAGAAVWGLPPRHDRHDHAYPDRGLAGSVKDEGEAQEEIMDEDYLARVELEAAAAEAEVGRGPLGGAQSLAIRWLFSAGASGSAEDG